MVFKKSSGPGKARWKFLPEASGGHVELAFLPGWEVHGMDLGPWNASRMDHFKSSGRVPHERRYLHTLRPFLLTSMIEIVMIHVRIFIFLLHSHGRFLQ